MSDKQYTPGEYYQPLFDYLQDQFGVLALVSDMEEIIEIVNKMQALHPSESAGVKGAVWVKGNYEMLWEQIQSGIRTVCYVDYHWDRTENAKAFRDICTIRKAHLEFSARGIAYGGVAYVEGDLKQEFLEECERMNVEWLCESTAAQGKEEITDHEHEKEVMMQAFDKVRKIFESRSWIMQGRGSYPYDDDRYKEEVRYMYDEFDSLYKDTWKNIKSKTFEYRNKIIEQYKKGSGKEDAVAFFLWASSLPRSTENTLEELYDIYQSKKK